MLVVGFKGWTWFKNSLIDNFTFRLHYRYTFAILCIASLLTAAKQYLGDPINCIVDGAGMANGVVGPPSQQHTNFSDGSPESVFKTYCWTHGTFTLPSQLTGRKGHDLSHPGVGLYLSNESDPNVVTVTEDGDEIHNAFLSMRHAWYQWIVFVLFFQAILCFIPHFLWKSWEGGKLSLLIQNLDENTLDTDPETTKERRSVIVNYVLRNMRTHNLYVNKFIFCEFLNFINIIGQMYLMDVFFGGQFTTSAIYGSEVLSATSMDMDMEMESTEIEFHMNSMDSMVMEKRVNMGSKCTFHKYGTEGTIQNHDGLCILPINIITEKIYDFLWFWFLALTIWTCIDFCLRVVTIVSRYSRYLVFCGRSKSSNRADVAIIMEKMWLGDWFILMQLCQNMNPMVFHDLVTDLRDRMDNRPATMEMRNGDTYPTLPLLEKKNLPYPAKEGGEEIPQPYMDTP